MVSRKYERIEVTFNKDDPEEMELYSYILKNSNGMSKAKYIKNLIRLEKNKAKK